MKIAFEIVGTFIISLFFMSIPILCTLSFVYNWFAGLKLILMVFCFVEWILLINLLVDIADKEVR